MVTGKNKNVSITLLLCIGIAAISFSSIFVKWSDAPVSVMGMYRLWMTDLLMLPFLYKYWPEIKSISRKDWLLLFLSGLALALHFLFWMGSLRYTTVASSTVLMTLEPIMVMIGAFWIFKERTTLPAVLSMMVAILGAILIGWGDIGLSATALKGDLLSIIGTVSVAIHMLLGQNLRARVSSFAYSFFVFLFAGTVFLLYNLFLGYSMIRYGANDWIIFALLAIVPTVFGHIMFNWLLQYVNAATVSMSVLGEPVGASVLAYFLLGESMTALQLSASMLLLFGVWLFLKTNRVTYDNKLADPAEG